MTENAEAVVPELESVAVIESENTVEPGLEAVDSTADSQSNINIVNDQELEEKLNKSSFDLNRFGEIIIIAIIVAIVCAGVYFLYLKFTKAPETEDNNVDLEDQPLNKDEDDAREEGEEAADTAAVEENA